MKQLTSFVLDLAENCTNVPQWLLDHQDYKPSNLLGKVTSQWSFSDSDEIEESKDQ